MERRLVSQVMRAKKKGGHAGMGLTLFLFVGCALKFAFLTSWLMSLFYFPILFIFARGLGFSISFTYYASMPPGGGGLHREIRTRSVRWGEGGALGLAQSAGCVCKLARHEKCRETPRQPFDLDQVGLVRRPKHGPF